MSIKLVLNVIKQCKRKASEKLMLIVLSEFANDKGSCYPSFETLAKGCNVSTRQAQNIIYKLIAEGDISASRREGGSNVYQFLRYLQPVTRETHCVTPPTQFSENENTKVGNTHETHFESPTQFLGDTHEILPTLPTKPISYEPKDKSIEPKSLNPKNKNYVVAPVGDNTAHPPLLELGLTTPEGKDTLKTQEAVKPVIEGLPKHISSPQTNLVNNTTSPTNPPPIAPPRADKVRHLTDHQQMVGAIVKAFGWSFKKMTKDNYGLVGKVARELREASATPDQIPALYEFCKGQKWSSDIFTPSALSKQWANFCATQTSSGEILPVWTPPEGYVGVKFDYPKPPIYDPQAQTDADATEELTPAQMRDQLAEILKKFAQKMTIEEIPMSEDDPMNEVLTW
jgi:predicted transcriptional regulator